MSRSLSLVALVLAASIASADDPRFRFHKGETLTYRMVRTTVVTETILDEKTAKPVETQVTTKMDVTRCWKVTEFDTKAIATLEFTIAALRWERKAGADEDVFDSEKPDDLNRKEMAQHVGPVLAVLKFNPLGHLLTVNDCKIGSPKSFEMELPFKMTLPPAEPKVGESWDRTFTIQIDPPHGTGEKYTATQKYTVQEPKGGFLTVGVATTIKDLPGQAADRVPLLPNLLEGTLFFHAPSGRYYGARLRTERTLKNHQGEGSSYKYVSTYSENFVPAN